MTPVVSISLSLAYVVPFVLLAWYLTAGPGRRPRWLLVFVLSVLPVFYAGHYLLLQQVQGWPSTAELPQEFQLLAFDISEPGPGVAEDGGILLWVRAAADRPPRVHRLAYSRKLHQALVSAGGRMAEGRGQTGTRVRRPGGTAALAADDTQEQIRFEDTRDTALPAKD